MGASLTDAQANVQTSRRAGPCRKGLIRDQRPDPIDMSVPRRQRSVVRKPKPAHRQARPIMEQLESRWMMSADLVPVELPIVDPAPWPPAPAVVADLDAPRRELVVIDGGLPDVDALLAGIVADTGRHVEVVILGPDADGFVQLTELLSQRDDLDALHVLSHGRAGALQLGNVTLDTDALDLRAAALTKWHRAFRAGADILLYGCDLAGNLEGVRFMDTLGALTGMDVAASDDATGAAHLGGDWELEVVRGTVDTGIAFDAGVLHSYGGVLTLVAEDTFPNSGNLDGDTTGVGWADAWSVDSSRMQANGADLSDPAGLLAGAGSSVIGRLTTALPLVTATRNLSVPVGADGTVTWIGFLVQPDSTSVLDYMGLIFGNTASDVAYAGYSGTSFILSEVGTFDIVTAPGVTATDGQAAFIAVKIEAAAGNDTITMYVNPTPGLGAPDSTHIAVKSDIDLGSFTRIGILTGRGLSANEAQLDDIRVGSSFLDVAPSLQVTTTADSNASGIVEGNGAHTVAWLNANRGTSVSLREAIIAANNTIGTDTILFNIAGSGPHTISLTSALPAITDAIVIDGTSEPGYVGTPIIAISGSAIAGAAIGLDLQLGSNVVLGLTIRDFNGDGLRVASSSAGNVIADNVITANAGAGVALASPGAQAAIRNNLIHANGGQGIDLGADGVVAVNDAGDGDTGANGLLNFPVIYGVTLSGAVVTITGEASAGAVVEFFESSNDANGHGEGASSVGFATVGATGTPGTVDPAAIQFAFSFAQGTLVLGDTVTATATVAAATSEFSANVVVVEPNIAPVLDAARSPALSTVMEDAGAPVGAVGTRVSQLVDFATPAGQVDNVTDANTSPQLGIAVTAADTTNGAWWYSIDDGATWLALGSPTAGAARLLTADAGTRLYYQPDANTNGTLATAITFRAWDRTTGSNGGTADTTVNGGATAFSTGTDTASLVVTAVNDAPTVSAIGASMIAEDSTTGAIAITIADVDSAVGTLVLTATSSNTALIPNGNLVLGGSGANRTITVTPAANASGGPATITLTVSDGVASTSTTFDVTVTAVNDAPVVTAPASVSGHVDTPITFSTAANHVVVADIDAGGGLVELTLAASDGAVVTLTGIGGLTFTTGDGTGDATMVFSGSVADINAALNGMVLTPAFGFDGLATLTVTIDDGGNTGSGGAQSDTAVIDIMLDPSEAPVVTLSGTPSTFTEGGADIAIDASLNVTDADSTHLVSAVVAITGGYRPAEDLLLFTDQLGIAGVWNAALGTLTLSGTATVVDYRTALRSVTYRNTSDAPGGANRTVAFGVSDSSGSGALTTTSLAVVADNDAPVMTVPGGQTVLEDTDLVFLAALGNAITITDPDAGMDGAQITLTATSGTLHLAATAGIAFGSGADGTASMAIAGTVADLNAALNGLVFRPAPNATAGVTLDFVAYDFGNFGLGGPKSDTASVIVTITPVNDVPVLTANTGSTLSEGGTLVLASGQLAATDIEDPASQLIYVVQALPAHGSLRRGGTAMHVGERFTQADITAGLVTYVHDGSDTTADAFGFDLQDTGLAGPTGNTFAFTVTPVDDPIVLSSAQLTVPMGGAVVVGSGAFTVTDPDGPAGPIEFTVRNVSGGAFERIAAAGTPITTFSAAEIVAGAIRFVADGSLTVPAFEVSATDGVHTTAFIGATVTLTGIVDANILAAAGSTPPPTVTAPPSNASTAATSTTAPAEQAIESEAGFEESTADLAPVPMAVPRAAPPRNARPPGEVPGAESTRASAAQSDAARPPAVVVGGATAIAPLVLGPSTPLTALPAMPGAPGAVPAPVAGPVDAANLTMDREALAAVQTALGSTEWRGALEKAKAETTAQGRVEALVVGSSTAVAGSLSVGYVMWLVRGGVLLSSLMSSLPAWRVLDPLPILGRSRDDEEESDGEGPDDPLERLFMRARTALGRGVESRASVTETPK